AVAAAAVVAVVLPVLAVGAVPGAGKLGALVEAAAAAAAAAAVAATVAAVVVTEKLADPPPSNLNRGRGAEGREGLTAGVLVAVAEVAVAPRPARALGAAAATA
ncbi:unnamed protein product, partial [Laminaria digitata]